MDEHREEQEELAAIQREDEDDAREQEEAFSEGRSIYEPFMLEAERNPSEVWRRRTTEGAARYREMQRRFYER